MERIKKASLEIVFNPKIFPGKLKIEKNKNGEDNSETPEVDDKLIGDDLENNY